MFTICMRMYIYRHRYRCWYMCICMCSDSRDTLSPNRSKFQRPPAVSCQHHCRDPQQVLQQQHICMYARMHVCMYAGIMLACMHACMHACMYVCMRAFVRVCARVCVCLCVCIYVVIRPKRDLRMLGSPYFRHSSDQDPSSEGSPNG